MSSGAKFYAIDELEYRLTEWNADGTGVRVYRRAPTWFSGRSLGLRGGPQHPADPRISGISVDSAGLIWVFTLVAADDYKQHWPKTTAPGGGVTERSASTLPDFNKLYQTRIEVLDLRSARVVARATIRAAIISALPNAQAAAYAVTNSGIPQVTILSFSVARQ
jgi:hypothetical protein